jgi:hypothetical protein
MEPMVKVQGLESALKTMREAFPADEKAQRAIINGSIRKAAAPTILAEAKQRAQANDKSGALTAALGIRNLSRRYIRTRRVVGGVEITPIRGNLKAMALYIDYYYTRRGRIPPAGIVLSGIRHGHLVDWGTVRSDPKPFLYPAMRSGMAPYMQRLANDMRRTIEQRVKRNAKKAMGRKDPARIMR